MRNRIIRWMFFAGALAALGAVFLTMVVDMTPRRKFAELNDYEAWNPEIVRTAETLPVQDGGRVKPLSTLAGFTMLRLHGARSMKIIDAEGETLKLGPTEWMLDCLFRPHLAVRLPTFRIDNAAVLEAIGIEAKAKRDRYSYSEIEGERDRLMELATGYEGIPDKERDPVQRQVLSLAYNVRGFESLFGYLGFARSGVMLMPVEEGGQPQRSSLSTVMATAPKIREMMAGAGGRPEDVPAHVRTLVDQVIEMANFSMYGLFLLPAEDPAEPWRSVGDRVMEVMRGQASAPGQAIGDIAALEKLTLSVGAGDDAFVEELGAFKRRINERAEARGELRALDLEASHYRANWLLRSLAWFLVAVLLGLGMWLVPAGPAARWLAWGTGLCLVAGLTFSVVAIVQRSVIMGRPPIGNLYDTIPFITASAVAVALVIELLTRRRFALGIAPVLGIIGLVLARRFEIGDAKDHMDPLVAVLDSNFWLTVHVITITLGYSSGLLAAALSHGYLLMRGLGLDGGDTGFRRELTRATYGTICLTLFLSLVGTVLGGIWANYSWGRFWGWDPKENGALMIVLWNLVILHARQGGLIKEWGLHIASVFGSCIVAFSWWHVNFLGVGLHNYGFASGQGTIWAFYAVEMTVILGAVAAWAVERARRNPAGRGSGRLGEA